MPAFQIHGKIGGILDIEFLEEELGVSYEMLFHSAPYRSVISSLHKMLSLSTQDLKETLKETPT